MDSPSLHHALHKPSGRLHRCHGTVDGHLLEHVPALRVHFQHSVAACPVDGLGQPLTVRAQNFIGAYLYQRGRQTAQVGKQRL